MGKASTLLLFALVLTGCAPLRVNLSGSEYRPTPSTAMVPKRVANITVINRAGKTEQQNHAFSDSLIPIIPEVSTQSTVESDIKLLLGKTLTQVRQK